MFRFSMYICIYIGYFPLSSVIFQTFSCNYLKTRQIYINFQTYDIVKTITPNTHTHTQTRTQRAKQNKRIFPQCKIHLLSDLIFYT